MIPYKVSRREKEQNKIIAINKTNTKYLEREKEQNRLLQ